MIRHPTPYSRLPIVLVTVCLTLGACSWRINWPEHRVTVGLESGETSGAMRTVNDRGFEVRVERLVIGVDRVELEACGDSPRELPGFSALGEWLIPSARAHGIDTPTRYTAPQVRRLVPGAGRKPVFGTLSPPPDDYCRLTIGIASMDEDARRLSESDEIVGRSLVVRGEYRPVEGSDDWRAFEWRASLRDDWTFRPENPWQLGDSESVEQEIRAVVHPEAWFEGIDFEETSETEAVRLLFGRARQSLKWEVR